MPPRTIPAELRRLVVERAHDRCEYCKLVQAGQEARFHIDHIVPLARSGQTTPDNLALACVSCSLRKGAREMATDPQTGATVRLFNPRRDRWEEQFAWENDVVLVGLTEIGRATVATLNLNRPLIVAIRRAEMALGRHPPS
ncbi:HNH endonuclease [Candidatus Acetothermia bacterium]|jgi:5-methylcytosine-specific restriction endonuclease McrA|nr:HNH endonuclease [Candidatus Acetothermia bacterium]